MTSLTARPGQLTPLAVLLGPHRSAGPFLSFHTSPSEAPTAGAHLLSAMASSPSPTAQPGEYDVDYVIRYSFGGRGMYDDTYPMVPATLTDVCTVQPTPERRNSSKSCCEPWQRPDSRPRSVRATNPPCWSLSGRRPRVSSGLPTHLGKYLLFAIFSNELKSID